MSSAVKGKPFVFKGVTWVDDCKTSAEVMKEAKLNFTVDKCEIVAKVPSVLNDATMDDRFIHGGNSYVDIENQYAIYRTDNNTPLGMVKGRYTPVQNIDAFNFFDDCIGKDKAIWQTAGCFDGGKRIFVSAKLPENILINGDPVENYLMFINSHDGSSGVKMMLTPIRVRCQNMLNAAIKQATSYITFRHTKTVHEKIWSATEMLSLCHQKVLDMKAYYDYMAKTKCSDQNALNLFGKVILNENEIEAIKNTGHTINQIAAKNWLAIEDSGISMKKVNAIHTMNKYYFEGPGQNDILGTMWGAYNAVTGFYSNCENNEGTKRMDTLMFGDRSRKIEFAGNFILDNINA